MKRITVSEAREIHTEYGCPFSFLIRLGAHLTIMGAFGNIHMAEDVMHRPYSGIIYAETLDVIL